MALFDVFRNPDGDSFLLDVQADLLSDLNTRVVVPLFRETKAPIPMQRLNPVIDVGGVKVVMMIHYLSAVTVSILPDRVTNLGSMRDEIVDVLDFLQQGFLNPVPARNVDEGRDVLELGWGTIALTPCA